jgi:hypothetical protein
MDLATVLNVVQAACQAFAVSLFYRSFNSNAAAAVTNYSFLKKKSINFIYQFLQQNPATHAEAESTLHQFRASPSPYAACQHILEHATDPAAKFQAILALRDAALREWTGLPPQMRNDLLRFLLHSAIIKFAADQPLLRRQASAAAATLLKRSWGELSSDQRRALITEVDTLATQGATVESKKASMEVFTAIVLEFCPSTSSPMGLPWSYHEECKLQLQEEFLPDFLKHAVSIASQGATAALTGNDGGTVVASLNLLSALLAWTYSPPPLLSSSSSMVTMTNSVIEMQQRPGEVTLNIRPPPAWRQILLLEEQGLGWLGPLAAGVRDNLTSSENTTTTTNSLVVLGQAVRQVLVQLSSMSGDIFTKENVDHVDHRHQLGLETTGMSAPGTQPGTRGRHLAFIFSIMLPEITPPSHAAFRLSSPSNATNDEAVLDTCRALLAAATAHRLTGFLEAAGSSGVEGGAPALFSLLSELTVAMMGSGTTENSASGGEDTEEAGDMLLEMWSELCIDPCRGAVTGNQHVITPAAAVFSATMRRELRRAAAMAWEDEEEYEGGEEAHSESWLAGLAAIGRAACPTVLPALAHQLQECQQNLERCMQRNEDPSAALEQLCWVVRMCSIILADAGDGEMPLIPISVAEACIAASTTGQEDPAVVLAQKLLALGAVCHQHAGQAVISPRLMEEVCVALGRWAETYLLPDPNDNSFLLNTSNGNGHTYNHLHNHTHPNRGIPGVFALFSDHQKAAEVSESLIRLAMSSLTQYPGDKTLHRAACTKLLAPLLRRRASCAVVVHCPAWLELCAASASRAQGIQQLEAGVQRRLMQCLIRASAGVGDSNTIAEYVSTLLHPLSHTLQELSKLPTSTLQQADKAQLALNLVQSLRGAARGVDHAATHGIVYVHLEAVQPALLHLLTVYQSQPSVYGQILKLAADSVEYHACILEASKARALFHWTVQLVQTYASHRTLATSAASVQLDEERAALCALLRLLTQLTNAEGSDESDVAAAVFEGLDRIMPSIQSEHLKFPKLRSAFFGLVAHLIEAHASKVGELPAPTFSALMKALCFGIGVQDDTETEAAVFEAAGALAKHHVMSIRHGGAGLGQLNMINTSSTTTTDPTTTNTALGEVLHALFERVLINDPGFEAVDYASEAALPLCLAEPAAAQGILNLVASRLCGDEGAVASIGTAFQELGKAAIAAAGMDRVSRRQFNGCFRRFVIEVRGVLKRR